MKTKNKLVNKKNRVANTTKTPFIVAKKTTNPLQGNSKFQFLEIEYTYDVPKGYYETCEKYEDSICVVKEDTLQILTYLTPPLFYHSDVDNRSIVYKKEYLPEFRRKNFIPVFG